MAAYRQIPMFSETQLLQGIQSFLPDISATINDLRSPSSNFVFEFYRAFLDELGANTPHIAQAQNNQMTLISHMDMFNNILPTLNLYNSIKFFLLRLGIEDFSISDLLNPAPKRNMVQMSAVLHFLTYCDDRVANLRPEIDKLFQLKERRDTLLNKIDSSRESVNEKAKERVERQEQIEQLKKIVEAEKIKLNELLQEVEQMKKAMINAKEVEMEDDKRTIQLANTIRELEENMKQLRCGLVKSPQKLKIELDQLEQKKNEIVEAIEQLKAQLEEYKKHRNEMENEGKVQETRIEKLNEMLEIQTEICKLNKSCLVLENKIAKSSETIDELKRQKSICEQKKMTLRETSEEMKTRKVNQEVSHKERLLAAETEYNTINTKIEEEVAKSIKLQTVLNDYYEKITKLEKEYEKVYLSFQRNFDAIVEEENKLLEEFELYKNEMDADDARMAAELKKFRDSF